MLSVSVPAKATIRLLDLIRDEWTSLLRLIATSLTPRDPDGREQLVDDKSPLSVLWKTLEDVPGIGWVTASTLCARKRPALAPVYDQHVRAPSAGPTRWWSP